MKEMVFFFDKQTSFTIEDELEKINDRLFDFVDGSVKNVEELGNLIINANALLKEFGFSLSDEDIKNVVESLSDPENDEAINLVIPIFKDNEQSDFNLSVSYFRDDEKKAIVVDMEVQYFWEGEFDLDGDEDDELEEGEDDENFDVEIRLQ